MSSKEQCYDSECFNNLSLPFNEYHSGVHSWCLAEELILMNLYLICVQCTWHLVSLSFELFTIYGFKYYVCNTFPNIFHHSNHSYHKIKYFLAFMLLEFWHRLISVYVYIYVSSFPLRSQALASDWWCQYRKVSNIRRSEFQNLNDSRPVLQLSLPNLLKPDVKSRMKM